MRAELGREKLNMKTLATFCGGTLRGADYEFSAIATDSREASANTLFIAMKGERVDGYDYIPKAYASGCRTFLCERYGEELPTDASYLIVDNIIASLSALGKSYTENSKAKIAAVTGSVGKTTTKDLIAAALCRHKIYKTKENYNSVIGLPLSLLEISHDDVSAVLEMGMSGRGEISGMSRAARPDVAVITNIGSSHLEMLGTRKNIRAAKLEIIDGLKSDGRLIINGDDKMLFGYPISVKALTAGTDNEKCDYKAFNIETTETGSIFSIKTPDGIAERLEINVPGLHNVRNATLAYAAATLLGATSEEIREGFAAFRPTGMRMNIYDYHGIEIIEDCYNASPESVRAALDITAAEAKRRGCRATALLGDMKELGGDALAMHIATGEYAAKSGLSALVTYGELSESTAGGARDGGMEDVVHTDANPEHAARLLAERLTVGDVLLVKASRSMAAENVIGKLKEII